MGQKVNPHGARVGVIFNLSTRWYAGKKDFANNLVEDYKLREMLKKKYYATGISHIAVSYTHLTALPLSPCSTMRTARSATSWLLWA